MENFVFYAYNIVDHGYGGGSSSVDPGGLEAAFWVRAIASTASEVASGDRTLLMRKSEGQI